MHGADGHVAGEVLQVHLRGAQGGDTRVHTGQDRGRHRQRAQLSQGAAQDHPPRRQAVQHTDQQARRDQDVRLRHQRQAHRLDCGLSRRRVSALHGCT